MLVNTTEEEIYSNLLERTKNSLLIQKRSGVISEEVFNTSLDIIEILSGYQSDMKILRAIEASKGDSETAGKIKQRLIELDIIEIKEPDPEEYWEMGPVTLLQIHFIGLKGLLYTGPELSLSIAIQYLARIICQEYINQKWLLRENNPTVSMPDFRKTLHNLEYTLEIKREPGYQFVPELEGCSDKGYEVLKTLRNKRYERFQKQREKEGEDERKKKMREEHLLKILASLDGE